MFEVASVLGWWLVLTLLGALAFPLAGRIFGRLPDRGYGFSRALGLLIISYVLWMGASVRALVNSPATIWSLILLLAVPAALILRRDWDEIRAWAGRHKPHLITVEGLFLVVLVFWAFVRAHSPDIVGTEKPMELAFLNGILRSETFPPLDPWLSGYAISYYYFGFVMMTVVTQLTGTLSSVAFNLTGASWFALTIIGSYSLLYNLISVRRGRPSPFPALLGPLFVAIAGNLEGFLEVLHARHFGGWTRLADGTWHSPFWSWLDIKDLVNPPAEVIRWISTRHWWWWRASRVVRDVNLAGADVEVIDEFPFFSFLLADNHPHVLALPFVLLVLGLALQVYLGGVRSTERLPAWIPDRWLVRVLAGAVVLLVFGIAFAGGRAGPPLGAALITGLRAALPLIIGLVAVGTFLLLFSGRYPILIPLPTLALIGWAFGSLAFLNAWDFPIYLAVFLVVLYLAADGERFWERAGGALATGFLVFLIGVIAYAPWYPTFASQAGGILPNLAFPTKIQHTVVMWGVAMIPIVVWLSRRLRDGWQEGEWRWLVGLGLGLPLVLFLISWIAAGTVGLILSGSGSLDQVLGAMGAVSAEAAFAEALARRLAHSWTALTLGLLISGAAVLMLRNRPSVFLRPGTGIDAEGGGSTMDDGDGVLSSTVHRQPSNLSSPDFDSPVWKFVLPLVLVGALLILGPEFFYLRDLFGSRMNTVFKFYYGAWILWGVAGAYALAEIWPQDRDLRSAARALAALPLVLGLFYPVLGTLTRAQGFSPVEPITLDGTAYMERVMPADAAAIDWLNSVALEGPLVEAVGPQYSSWARVSTQTGLATVLGWAGHEHQWRGSFEPMGEREVDIGTLYRTRVPADAQAVVEKYGVRFVYVGDLERQTYGQISERKFEAFMTRVYEMDGVFIYALTGEAPAGLVNR